MGRCVQGEVVSRVTVKTPDEVGLGPASFKAPTSISGLIVALTLVIFLRFIYWTWLLMILVGAAGVPWGVWRCALPFGLILTWYTGVWKSKST